MRIKEILLLIAFALSAYLLYSSQFYDAIGDDIFDEFSDNTTNYYFIVLVALGITAVVLLKNNYWKGWLVVLLTQLATDVIFGIPELISDFSNMINIIPLPIIPILLFLYSLSMLISSVITYKLMALLKNKPKVTKNK